MATICIDSLAMELYYVIVKNIVKKGKLLSFHVDKIYFIRKSYVRLQVL